MSNVTPTDTKNSRVSLSFNGESYRLVSIKQLVNMIFALGFQMFSPAAAEILIDVALGQQHFHPALSYKRKAITGVTSLILYDGCYGSFTFVYENTITLCLSPAVPQNATILNNLLTNFDIQNAANMLIQQIQQIQQTQQTQQTQQNVNYLIRVNITPVLKYRFPRRETYKRIFCGVSRNFISGVNLTRYACNDFYHVIIFDCCSRLDFSAAKFVNYEQQKTTRLTPQDEAINNEYANPESPAANALFAGKLIIVAQQENSGVGLVKTDLLYPLIEKCLMSRPQPLRVDMPTIEYMSETSNYLIPIMQAYKELGVIKPINNSTRSPSNVQLGDVQNFVKTTLNFNGDGFYRLPENTKPLQPTGILIDKAFLLIYIDEKNNPILAGLIN